MSDKPPFNLEQLQREAALRQKLKRLDVKRQGVHIVVRNEADIEKLRETINGLKSKVFLTVIDKSEKKKAAKKEANGRTLP